jgi:hypothetical protein
MVVFAPEGSRSLSIHDGFGFTVGEQAVLRRLDSPRRIQDYLDGLAYDTAGKSCRSPRRVLRERSVQCLDAALLAAAALRFHGRPPLVLDLEADQDSDHVLALFRSNGAWGAVARSNYSGLRYRDAVYRTLRELVLSYFESYCNLRREKTLRRYSRPLSLARFDARRWMTTEDECWFVAEHLVGIRHYRVLSPPMRRSLARLDARSFAAALLGRVS